MSDERMTPQEQAWRNGWGSALNAMRAARSIAEKGRQLSPTEWEVADIIDEMSTKLVDIIDGLTEDFVAVGREIGFASSLAEKPPASKDGGM
jgi:hypothetical protein